MTWFETERVVHVHTFDWLKPLNSRSRPCARAKPNRQKDTQATRLFKGAPTMIRGSFFWISFWNSHLIPKIKEYVDIVCVLFLEVKLIFDSLTTSKLITISTGLVRVRLRNTFISSVTWRPTVRKEITKVNFLHKKRIYRLASQKSESHTGNSFSP